jgi:Gpi18-like mannosyltransferase
MMGLVLLGLLLRLPLLARDSGVYDAGYFRALLQAGASDLPGAYTRVSPDYPPLTMLTFGLTGALTRWCCAPDLAPNDPGLVVAAKLPEVIASLALAATIGLVVWRRSGAALLAALATAAYALNPGVVYVSAFWTQAEALWVLPVALGLIALERGRFVLAWVAFAAAVLTKPQAAAFVPLLLVATGRDTPRSTWLTGPAAAFGLVAAASAPWWLTGHGADVAQVYLGLSGADAWVSGSAYNLWYLWLLGSTHQVPADSPFLAGLTYQHVGWLLFAVLLAWVVWRSSRRQTAPSLYLAAATLWLGLAVLLTQTHERYFHPVLPLLLLAPELYATRSRLWLVWTALTLAYAYNLITVLPFDGFPGPSLIAEPDGGLRVRVLRLGSLLAAATFLASLVVLAFGLRPRAPNEKRLRAYATSTSGAR